MTIKRLSQTIRTPLTLCIIALAPAFLFFYFLFTKSSAWFWIHLPLSVAVLCMISFIAEPASMKEALKPNNRTSIPATVFIGLFSALILYVIFFAGNILARMMLPWGASDIDAVYSQGVSTPRWIVAALLLFIIGPGEEIFWRGYIQRRLSTQMGTAGILLSILAYTGVHIATGNVTLVMAALVCGSFWAALYRFFDSLWINMISHAVWATIVFVLLPFK